MSGYVQSNQIILVPNIAAYAVSPSDTGKTLITPQTTIGVGNITISLPAPASGLHYRFINGGSNAVGPNLNVRNVAITATAAIVFGQIICGPVGGIVITPVDALTTLNFVTVTTLKGDCIDMYCDGTNWYVDAKARTAGSITAA